MDRLFVLEAEVWAGTDREASNQAGPSLEVAPAPRCRSDAGSDDLEGVTFEEDDDVWMEHDMPGGGLDDA